MAFSDFKNIAEVQKQYQIKYQADTFIFPQEAELPSQLRQDLEFYQTNIDVFISEAARSEIIISPLLREVYKKHYQQYAFWIQKSITYDHILCGTPDYIISSKSELGKTVLAQPILLVVS